MATHSCVLAWKCHGQMSLAIYRLWDCKESVTTEQLTILPLLLKVTNVKYMEKLCTALQLLAVQLAQLNFHLYDLRRIATTSRLHLQCCQRLVECLSSILLFFTSSNISAFYQAENLKKCIQIMASYFEKFITYCFTFLFLYLSPFYNSISFKIFSFSCLLFSILLDGAALGAVSQF